MSWPLVKLKECCQVISGGTPKREISEYWGGDIDWVTPKDLSSLNSIFINTAPEKITPLGLQKSSATLLPTNSVLFSSRAPIGHLAITTKTMATNQGFKSLVPSNNIDSKYLYYCIKHFKPAIEALGNGATFKEVSKKVVENFKIPLPPLPVQNQIASVLEKADTLRSQCQQMEQALNSLAQSVFLDMFGDPVTNPKKWETLTLNDQLEFLTSGSRGWAKHYDDSGKDTFIRIQNILKDKMSLNDIQKITAPDTQEATRTRVRDGDVLLSITADLGRAGVVRNIVNDCYISQHLALLRVNQNKLIPEFLSAFLVSPAGLNQFEQKNKGGTKAGLNFTDIRSLKITLPPRELQLKFKLIKQEIDKKLVEVKILTESQNALFNSLMQRAFKGELDLKDVA